MKNKDEMGKGKFHEAELRYSTLFRQSPDGILLIDTKGNILDFNEAAHLQLGYSREEFAKLGISDLDPAESQEEIQKKIDEILIKGKAEHEVKHRTKHGEIRDVHVITQTLLLSGKTVFHTIWRDITKRRQAEYELEFFRDLINKSNDAIFVNDPQTGLFIIVNDKACTSLGYDRQELLKMGVADIETTFPDNFSWQTHVNELRHTGALMLEGVHKKKNGTTFPVEANISYAVLTDREYMVAVVRDITERRAAEQELKKSEERLFKAQKMAHVGTWEWNIVENRLYWSDEVYRIYGLDPEHFMPTFESVGKTMHPDDLESFIKAVNAALYERKPFELDYRLIRPDGTVRTVHTIGEVFYDPAGKPLMKIGTVQDITERKKAEEALRSSREFIASILDTVDEGFIVVDRDYRIISANKAYSRQVNMPAGDIAGRACHEISHQSKRRCYEQGEECAVRHSFEKGEPHACFHRHHDNDGNVIYVETKSYPLRDAYGNVTSVIETINNITDRHLLEEQILRTQKLEAVGLLAGGIAHDFNNLLQGVFGSISMAKMFSASDGEAYQMLEGAERALNLSKKLTKQLLTFSKGGEPVKSIISLPSILQDSVKFALSGSNVKYTFSIDKDLWSIEADEGQISQVIHNIVLNAGDAMPGGGTIRIKAANLSIGQKSVLPLKRGKYVLISIEDTGIGIPGNYITRIFDPYFTTKQKGSGLGLATTFSIIKKHDGMLNVESSPGKGSTFFIYLPAIETKQAPKKEEGKDIFPGKGRILVMDDEEIIKIVVGQMLKSLGYECDFAENGEQTVEKYTDAMSSGEAFDAVILDLTVRGGMGGKETIRKLLETDPAVRAIVSSGYSDDPVVANYEEHGFKATLSKPYEIETLSSTLHSLLCSESK